MQSAICLVDSGEQQVSVQVDADSGAVTWNRRKYRQCITCFPDANTTDTKTGVVLYMQQNFLNPLQCSEKDLHPWVLPPPLDQAVLYGPAVLVLGVRRKSVVSLTLAAWGRIRRSLLDHAWVTVDAGLQCTYDNTQTKSLAFSSKPAGAFLQADAAAVSYEKEDSEEEESLEESDYESEEESEENESDIHSNSDQEDSEEDNIAADTDEFLGVVVDDEFDNPPTAKRRRYQSRRV